MQYIIKDTSGKVWFGPIVKSTDGYSALTGIGTAVATGAVTFMYGTSSTGDMTTAHSWEEVADGCYMLGLASNAIGTLGHLRINFLDSSGIPTYEDVRVVSTNIYNSFITTADYLQIDISEVAGTTVASATAFKNTTSDNINANVTLMAGETVTTDAADNWDNYFYNNDVVSTQRVSDAMTVSTVTPLNVGAISSVALTTQAGANFQLFFNDGGAVTTEVVSDLPTTADLVTTGSNMNVGAVAGSTLAGTTDLKDNLTTDSDMNIGAVAGTTVASATAFQADVSNYSTFDAGSETVNVGEIAGETVTTDAADNWDNYWFNNDVVSTERVGELPTTVDLLTTSDEMEANVVAVSSQALTTQAGANFQNFFNDGGAVSTEVVGDLPTTADLFTTASQVDVGRIAGSTVSTASAQIGVNVVEIADETVTTDAADNWDNFWFNNDVVSTERVSDTPTTADLFTTASQVDVGRIAGSTISTAAAQIGVNVIEIASGSATDGTISTATEYDNMPHGTLMKYLQAYAIGEFKVTGGSSNQIVYDEEDGTTFFSHTITTATRTFTSN